MSILKGQKAQAAIELAVFGSILVFALGAILSSGVGRGNQQNAILKTTRLALIMSYDTSGHKDDNNQLMNASRNTASVLVIEDRLSVGSSKYGPIDRVPTVISGSGTHSSNMFMPVDFGDSDDLPLYDIFVNGQHFSLTTSAFKTIDLDPGGGTCDPGLCPAKIWDYTSTNQSVRTALLHNTLPDDCTTVTFVTFRRFVRAPACYREVCLACPPVQKNCVQTTTKGLCFGTSPCPAGCNDCSVYSRQRYSFVNPTLLSCFKFYAVVNHHPGIDEWCDGEPGGIACPTACSTTPSPGCNLSADKRFDLYRDDTKVVPRAERRRFSWQWYLIMGYDEAEQPPPLSILYNDLAVSAGLAGGEGINSNPEDGLKNLQVDVDQDLRTEIIFGKEVKTNNGIITSLGVQDFQDGDVNFQFDARSQGIAPGFTSDINIYTRVAAGTYLRLEEGKLFSPTGDQYIRTASKKNTVDIIERVFKLSNDTGRFCTGPFTKNPAMPSVEACGNCFRDDHITLTCVDVENPEGPFLYIRSRIEDYHGHKWVTKITGDPYVEFLR